MSSNPVVARFGTGVHWSFWAIGTIMLIWNIMGVVNFFAQMNADVVAAMPETHRAIIEVRPVWGTIAFAIAVFAAAQLHSSDKTGSLF